VTSSTPPTWVASIAAVEYLGMAEKPHDHHPPCRVCGGDTELADFVGRPPTRREQRRCVSQDCAGHDWWVQRHHS
jgi:hypothetical protein